MAHVQPVLAAWFEEQGLLVTLLPAAGLALIIVGLMTTLRARRRRAGSNLTAREELERVRQKDAVRGDLEQLMVEIEQLARRMSAQLDAKSIELDSLVRKADERIAELRRLTSATPAPPAPTPPLGGDRAAASAPPASAARSGDGGDPLATRVCDLASQGLTPGEIARRLDEHVGKVELILALRRT